MLLQRHLYVSYRSSRNFPRMRAVFPLPTYCISKHHGRIMALSPGNCSHTLYGLWSMVSGKISRSAVVGAILGSHGQTFF